MNFCACWLNLFADVFRFLFLGLRSRSSLAAENLCLRKQLALTVVTPRTFVGWHRQGFRSYWRRKCQAGRPPIPLELQHLIRRMARENPSWGEELIANELLLKLGLRVSPRTVQKYWPKVPAAPADNPRRDQRWSTFLKNHAAAIIACDFCVVASATFGCLRIGGHGTRVAPNYSP
jgi:putative transposase